MGLIHFDRCLLYSRHAGQPLPRDLAVRSVSVLPSTKSLTPLVAAFRHLRLTWVPVGDQFKKGQHQTHALTLTTAKKNPHQKTKQLI